MSGKQITIIDYKLGNIHSIKNALQLLGCQPEVSSESEVIQQSDAFVFPGVGSFPKAMENLHRLDLIGTLESEVIEKKKPLLGICLGMQLLAKDSTEKGSHKGLGWIDAHVVQFDAVPGLRFPHVGWNEIQLTNPTQLFTNIKLQADYFFDHNYYMICKGDYVTATCHYGIDFVAGIQKENIFATQFHPEKSQNNGLRILRNFLNYVQENR